MPRFRGNTGDRSDVTAAAYGALIRPIVIVDASPRVASTLIFISASGKVPMVPVQKCETSALDVPTGGVRPLCICSALTRMRSIFRRHHLDLKVISLHHWMPVGSLARPGVPGDTSIRFLPRSNGSSSEFRCLHQREIRLGGFSGTDRTGSVGPFRTAPAPRCCRRRRWAHGRYGCEWCAGTRGNTSARRGDGCREQHGFTGPVVRRRPTSDVRPLLLAGTDVERREERVHGNSAMPRRNAGGSRLLRTSGTEDGPPLRVHPRRLFSPRVRTRGLLVPGRGETWSNDRDRLLLAGQD
jgi:hypothetical protein